MPMRLFLISIVLALSAAPGARGGDWPQFRGPHRDNASSETGLLRAWPAEGPKVLWKTPVCEGYAGAAIKGGRVYLNDYNLEKKEHLLRAISLADGKDLWGWSYPVEIKPSHGITRTVPAVGEKLVFSLDPKSRFHAIDAATGKLVWEKDLVQEYKCLNPQWYAGENPLLDGDRVILGIGGDSLAIAFDQATGKEVWRAPNPEKFILSHSSVMPAEIGGVRQLLYFHMRGLAGISAQDGKLLWTTPFRARMAAAPSPVAVGDGRVFITSGYEAGSQMVRVEKTGESYTARKLFELKSSQFNSEVHTPVLHQGHLFAVGKKQKGRFTCVDLEGNVVWESPVAAGDPGKSRTFGLGGFFLADGMFFVLDGDSGMLRLIEASVKEYKELAGAQVLSGQEVWGPMALSDGKLVLRDLGQMVCIQVGGQAVSAR